MIGQYLVKNQLSAFLFPARGKIKSTFTAAANVAHAGIKRQECTSGPLCPLPAAGPLLTVDPAKRCLLLKH